MSLAAQVSALMLSLIDAFLRPTAPALEIVVIGTTGTSASVTTLGSLAGVAIRSVVTGSGVPTSPATTVLAMDDAAHTLTLSAATTTTVVGTPLTFSNPAAITSPQMGLYTNVITPSSATLLSDLTEPVYPGYARQAMTINAVKIDALGNHIEDYASCHFQPTGTDGSPLPIQGYFVAFTYAGAAALFYTEPFPAPVNLVVATDSLDVLFDGYVSNIKSWGGICALC